MHGREEAIETGGGGGNSGRVGMSQVPGREMRSLRVSKLHDKRWQISLKMSFLKAGHDFSGKKAGCSVPASYVEFVGWNPK